MQLNQRKISKVQRIQRKRRGIYILPNLLTTGALFFGFFSIIQAALGKFEVAAVAILIATVLDGLDGRVARLTNTSSDFGKEYDSLSDVICFGLAPALVVFDWSLSSLGKVGWLCAFLYVSATALRLARFNTHSAPNPGYFQGLPCPMAAAFLVTWMWVVIATENTQLPYMREITTAIVVILALAMVSAIPFFSFKNIGVKGRIPFVASIAMVFGIALISFDPPRVLFALISLYLVSGPFIWLSKRVKNPSKRVAKEDELKNRVDPEN